MGVTTGKKKDHLFAENQQCLRMHGVDLRELIRRRVLQTPEKNP